MLRIASKILSLISITILLLYSTTVFSHKHASEPPKQIKFDIIPLSPSLSFVRYDGSGAHIPGSHGWSGNILLSKGSDGVFMVDSSFTSLKQSKKLLAAIKTITSKPLDFIISTHYHQDHTGGNVFFGRDALIIAQNNTRRDLAEGRMPFAGMKLNVPKLKPGRYSSTLPKITFQKELNLHYNNDHIFLEYYPNAHTNGDIIVLFKKANIVMTGDLYVSYGLPFIDFRNDGSIKGLISAVGSLVKQVDDKTIIIPGHGPAANKKDLEKYYALLLQTRKRMIEYSKQGKSIKEVLKLMGVSDNNRLRVGAVTNWYDVITKAYYKEQSPGRY